MKEIFFCENNVSKGLEDIIERIENEYPDVYIYIPNHVWGVAEIVLVYYIVS